MFYCELLNIIASGVVAWAIGSVIAIALIRYIDFALERSTHIGEAITRFIERHIP